MTACKYIKIKEICNLSRVPCSIHDNPLYKTCLQYKENKNIDYKKTFLYDHYQKKEPQNLSNFYDLNIKSLSQYPYDSCFLPWYHTSPVTRYRDKSFIKADDSFIKTQFDKLINLYKSIKTNGYNPEQYTRTDKKGPGRPRHLEMKGNITGYYLKGYGTTRFYVVSGNHRVAICPVALSEEITLPIMLHKLSFVKPKDRQNCGFLNEKHYPTEFSIEKVNSWASVKSGFLTAKEAEEIFQKYIFA